MLGMLEALETLASRDGLMEIVEIESPDRNGKVD